MRLWAVLGLCALLATPARADGPGGLPLAMWERVQAVQPETVDLTPTPSPAPPEALSLRQCVDLAFRHNRGFRGTQEGLLASRRGLWVTDQRISYSLSASAERDRPSGASATTSTSASAAANWRGLAGDTLGFGVSTASQDSFGDLLSRNPSLSLNYRRPILRGAGRASSTYQGLRRARVALLREELSFYEARQDLALAIIQQYFAALQAQGEIDIQRRALQRSQDFYDQQRSLFTGEGVKDPDEEWVTLSPGETRAVKFRLEALPAQSPIVTGTVTAAEGGGPLPGATLRILDGEDRWRNRAATDADGAYAIRENLLPGAARVKCELPGYATQNRTVTLAAGETTVVDFQLAPAPAGSLRLTGTVTAAEGSAPVSGATLSVFDGTGQWRAKAATGEDGKYAASENLLVGPAGVICEAEGYAADYQSVTLRADQTIVQDFELEAASAQPPTITGKAEADDGAPLAGATVSVFDITGQLRAQATTAADGTCALSGNLPVGSARVRCERAGYIAYNPWVTEVPEIEVDQALLALERAKQDLIGNEQAVQDTMDRLLLEIGLLPGAAPRLTTSVGYSPRDYDEQALVETALRNSIRLANLYLSREDALESRRLVYAEAKPDLSARFSLSHAGEAPGDGGSDTAWLAGLQVDVPLRDRARAEAKASADRALLLLEQQLIAERDSEAQAIGKLLRENGSAKASIAIGEQNVKLAQKNRDRVQAMFEESLAGYDYLKVRDADERLVDAERSLLRQKVGYFVTTVQIRRTLGEDITQGLPE